MMTRTMSPGVSQNDAELVSASLADNRGWSPAPAVAPWFIPNQKNQK